MFIMYIPSDYWWYSTNSITSIEDSFVYKLNDSYKPSLESYEFYLALKEKPALSDVYTRPGKFYDSDKGYLEITETAIQWKLCFLQFTKMINSDILV